MSSFPISPDSFPEGEPKLGEGVSRPLAKARTKLFQLRVVFRQSKPMVISLRAETAARAKLYAKNCWPLAKSIELIR